MMESSGTHQRVLSHIQARCYDRALIPNLFRGEYVEAMVLHLLGVDRWHQTDPWSAFDLIRLSDGARGEVKQSAILQSWYEDVPAGKSGPSFSTAPRPDGSRIADFYIFALHDIDDPAVADHRREDQWRFFVVAEKALTAAIGEQKSIGLKALAPLAYGVDSKRLAGTVQDKMPVWSL